jgi:chemotaxis protein MotB
MSVHSDDSLHRGGAWKVAYADFVTALMALFIVLWLMSSSREIREAVGGYFRDPQGHVKQIGTAHAGSGEGMAIDANNVGDLRRKLEAAMRHLPGFRKFAQNVQFTMTGEGLRVELLESDGGMFFETGSPRPTANGEALFRLLAVELGRVQNPVAIEGHTDARPYRSKAVDAYGNWELSFDRANMARGIMLAYGVRADQIAEIRGYADRRILFPSNPTDSRNRRVSVVMKYERAP